MCPFCRSHTESIAHLMNGCREVHNFYNRRHNRIADKIAEEIKLHLPQHRSHSNKLAENFRYLYYCIENQILLSWIEFREYVLLLNLKFVLIYISNMLTLKKLNVIHRY